MAFPKNRDIEIPLLQVLIALGGRARPKLVEWVRNTLCDRGEMDRWLREEVPVFAWSTPAERLAVEDLVGELSSVWYTIDSNGLIVVEDKDSMRKRLGHSPDLADALGCSFGAAKPWGGQVVIL